MSITVTVENGIIKLPPGVDVPNGTKLEINLPEPKRVETESDSSHSWMLKFAGIIEGPEDMAAEHDHYAHGAPKRGGK